jgi:hypothetical protein
MPDGRPDAVFSSAHLPRGRVDDVGRGGSVAPVLEDQQLAGSRFPAEEDVVAAAAAHENVDEEIAFAAEHPEAGAVLFCDDRRDPRIAQKA